MNEMNLPVEYRFADIDGNVAVERVVRLGLDQVQLHQDGDGFLTVTERPQPPVAAPVVAPAPAQVPKFRTEPEGDMLRIYATRRFVGRQDSVHVGERGGLIANEHCLSQDGNCWIDEAARVGRNVRVSDDAYVAGCSDISGFSVTIRGNANVYGVTIAGVGAVDIGGDAMLTSTQIRTDAKVRVTIGGTAVVANSTVAVGPARGLAIMGCCIESAELRGAYDLVSLFTPQHGWLDAFRSDEGVQVFSIGCQRRDDADSMRNLADENGYVTGTLERGLLEGFLQMAAAARAAWPDQPPAAPAVEINDDDDDFVVAPAPASAAGFPVSTASVFSEAAAAAREAALKLRHPY